MVESSGAVVGRDGVGPRTSCHQSPVGTEVPVQAARLEFRRGHLANHGRPSQTIQGPGGMGQLYSQQPQGLGDGGRGWPMVRWPLLARGLSARLWTVPVAKVAYVHNRTSVTPATARSMTPSSPQRAGRAWLVPSAFRSRYRWWARYEVSVRARRGHRYRRLHQQALWSSSSRRVVRDLWSRSRKLRLLARSAQASRCGHGTCRHARQTCRSRSAHRTRARYGRSTFAGVELMHVAGHAGPSTSGSRAHREAPDREPNAGRKCDERSVLNTHT